MKKQVIVITGASQGIGNALMMHLKGRYIIIGTYRSHLPETIDELREDQVYFLELDVTSVESIDHFCSKVKSILNGQKINYLINNAGVAVPSALLQTPVEKVRKQFEINVIGVYQLTSKLIPQLEENNSKIINIGSISAHFTTPFLAPYCASKASLERFTKSWRIELAHLGIQATQIDFGNVRTEIADKTMPQIKAAVSNIPAYGKLFSRIKSSVEEQRKQSMSSEKAAQLIEKVMRKKALKPNYLGGRDAKQLIFLQKFIPYSLLERIIKKRMGLSYKPSKD